MDKYEISLWEDYKEQGESFIRERKIAVIGSDTMEAQARALEPNLVEEINGTNTFTFKMYYTYTDNQTGEKYSNPFAKYLVNERKVKVFWKNKWYHFVIKKCQEDSSKKSVTYTCKDLFINELSKQGYNLEFATELQNNIGTAAELVEQVLEDSTWQYDYNASTKIIQKTEGPVYEVDTINSFNAVLQDPNGDSEILIPEDKKILVFYDSITSLLDIQTSTTAKVQFLYSEDEYVTDVNDMLVINGSCCQVEAIVTKSDNILSASLNGNQIFSINISGGISNKYRANRLVNSQKTEYDPLLDRYVLVCKDAEDNKVYEINTIEYTNPLLVINLIANPNSFKDVSGWIGNVSHFGIFPKFDANTIVAEYEAKSYLKLNMGDTYNSGIQGNISYFIPNDAEKRLGSIGGIQQGEKYIFRIKAKTDVMDAPNIYLDNGLRVSANLYKYNEDFSKIDDTAIFNQDSYEIIQSETDPWIEYTLSAKASISAEDMNEYGFFINVDERFGSSIWVEDIQFFKYLEGITSYEGGEKKRINPGEVNLQSIAVTKYKYYYPNSELTDAKQMTFIYDKDIESEDYTPIYNNYEKIATIEESESNRFNILQTIAETFKAWVHFRIDSEDDGSIKIIDGVPQKFVYFTEELEKDNGLSFEYGIDLQTITRSIDGDKLVTKIIVNPNNNEFAPNGFCTIARSDQNYCKENFILNLDYFVQQNLIDGDELNKDLYGVSDDSIGYYYYLSKYNKEYDNLTDELTTKKLDVIRQRSQEKIYEQYIAAASEDLSNIQNDLFNLAQVNSWEALQAYANDHVNNQKVQSLLNAYAVTQVDIDQYTTSLNDIRASLETLTDYIDSIVERQNELMQLIKAKHKEFNNKYVNYIMEGTWQDDSYVDDNKYYLDALNVAYTSSRPQISYDIKVLRLSSLEEFSSKVFNLGDICYIQDREFFGYLADKITPYKEKILVSKLSSFFDTPEKDVLTVQNYKTRFDDLFQRITATTQTVEYAETSFFRAADSINSDYTLDSSLIQNTFDSNADLVLNSSNQDVIWDDTGISVIDKFDRGNQTKIIAGGIFVTKDGGTTWRNAVSGDGISTELLTAGRINTNEIYIYDGNAPSFRWDSYGLTAYSYDTNGVNFNKFVRLDKYGLYGYNGGEDFVPTKEDDIWDDANFGLTWKGFFLKSGDTNSLFEISTEQDLVIKQNTGTISEPDYITRIKIGRLEESTNYGMKIYNVDGKSVFSVDTKTNVVQIGGWQVDTNKLYYEQYDNGQLSTYMYLNSDGTIVGRYTIPNTSPVEYGEWVIGQKNSGIDDNNAIINIGPTLIDANGIQTEKLYANNDVDIITGNWELSNNGLYNQGNEVIPFNLSTGITLSSSDDLDDFKTSGIYQCDSATSSSVVNAPTTDGFKISVMNTSSSDYVTQTAYLDNSSIEYKRQWNGSSWSDWGTSVPNLIAPYSPNLMQAYNYWYDSSKITIHNNRIKIEISQDKKWIRLSGFVTVKTKGASEWKYVNYTADAEKTPFDFIYPSVNLQIQNAGILFDQNKLPAYIDNAIRINIHSDGYVGMAFWQGTATEDLENTVYLFGHWIQTVQ